MIKIQIFPFIPGLCVCVFVCRVLERRRPKNVYYMNIRKLRSYIFFVLLTRRSFDFSQDPSSIPQTIFEKIDQV